jgi:protein O-GlcNAc transferase
MDTFNSAKQFFFQGLGFFEKEMFSEAEDRFEKALRLVPDRVSTLTNLSATKLKLKKFAEAKSLALSAIAADKRNSEAYLVRGLVELEYKNAAAALDCFDRAIEFKPDLAEAWSNKGAALDDLQRYEEALAHYDKAVEVKPDYAEAWLNKGVTLNNLRRYDEALALYDKAIELKPDYAEAWSNKGVTLNDLQRFDEALAHYQRAVELKPGYAKGWYNRGVTYAELKKYDEALASFDQAARLKPDLDFLAGQAVYTRLKVCDWDSFDSQIENLLSGVERGENAASPFSVLAVSGSEAINTKAARIWVKEKCPPGISKFDFIDRTAKPGKIRLGYFSSDYHDHATAYLIAGLFELHDKSRFELIAFSFGPDKNDASRRRLVAAFDRFIDVRDKSDRGVAQLSRTLGVDIAIDLNGFTQYSRTGIFACGAAPIQVSYLGYPGSMGAEYVDYIVADKTIIPESNRLFFSEKIVYLPHSYQVNDSRKPISDQPFTRSELGLPESGFVFCCFNNNHKINPSTFDSWMRILKQVGNSVLWLFEDSPAAAKNLRKEAAKRGISADRLVFARVMSLPQHLARHRAADLFLDTLPYNAHTTASDALWSGLPVLTLIGNTFAGKVAASLLKAIQLPELITTTQEQYEAAAVELATAPSKLGRIKEKLANNRLTAPLFDSRLFCKHIEAAYSEMYRRYLNNSPADHIYVEP